MKFRFISVNRCHTILYHNHSQLTLKVKNKFLSLLNLKKNFFYFRALFCFLFCSTLAFACFYLAIGGDPKYLKLAIVNEEVGNYKDCLNDTLITTFRHEEICEWYVWYRLLQ